MELLFKALILGIVEGITEFLPISSTGHLIILNRFVEFGDEFDDTFDIVIQMGAILSVLVYFFKALCPFRRGLAASERRAIDETWKKTVVAVLPALCIGAFLGDRIHDLLFNPFVVACALLLGGIALLVVERQPMKKASIESISALAYRTALAIGLIQCLAFIPGASRSAATIVGAMLLGVSRKTAAEFSFFLAIPTIAAASGYALLKGGAALSSAEWLAMGVGFAASFLTALAVIALFMNYIRSRDFRPFAYYRIALALAVFACLKIWRM